MSQMSARERTLVTIVSVIVVVLVNLLLFRFFFSHRARLGAELISRQSELEALQALFSEKQLWEQRGAWLEANQPKLVQEGAAGVQLLDTVKALAQKHSILLENPVIGNPDRRPHCTSVLVSIETKSPWPALVAFLHELQKPEEFMVFEWANVQKDSADQTQMRGKFKVAKWYAPK